MAKSIGILSLARQTLNRKTLIQIYYSFIYPYLLYCNLIWGKAADTHLWPIFKLQKMAIRIIHNIPRRTSTIEYFHLSKILRVPEIHTFTIGMFMHSYKQGKLPSIFDNFFRENRDTHHYPTRAAAQLRPPISKTNLAHKFIKRTGVELWNTISVVIPTDCSTATFKRLLKNHLLSKYTEQ